jgi:hypothetical protein
MKRTHLGVQTAVVLAMVAAVSWPEFRPTRVASVWRYAPEAVLQARAQDAARFGGNKTPGVPDGISTSVATFGYVSQQVAQAGGRLNALTGRALTSLNAPIPYARVVLLNIRTGQVAGRATANADGEFSFGDLDPNLYIVEVLGANGAVLGTSGMVAGMTRGELRTIDVRVASAATAVQAAVGNTLAATAPQATSLAAANDVTRTTTTQVVPVSPGASTGSAR